jgi:hypothetical protein
MIVQRMSSRRAAAGAVVPALAVLTLVTGMAAAPASASATPSFSWLASVSCTSSTACIAMGGRAGHKQMDRILGLSWNGRRWTPQVPVDGNHIQPNDLNSIACPSAAECFAVGSVGSFNVADHRQLIEMWNGTAWSVQALGNPKGTANDFMTSVSCGGPSLCFTVGNENDNTGLNPGVLLEKWNGTSWSVQPPLPEPAGATGIRLQAVSCVSPAECTAVGTDVFPGFTSDGTLAEHWNGTSWSIEPMPAQAKSAEPDLFSVSCSGTACMAAGSMLGSGGTEVPLAEWFNGTAWSVVHPAVPAGSTGIAVNGLACTSPAACYAVGVTGGSAGSAVTLIERWNGTSWSVVPSPNAPGTNTLTGISCVSTQSCIAVGESSTGSSTLSTLALKLSAGHWTITPTPSPG